MSDSMDDAALSAAKRAMDDYRSQGANDEHHSSTGLTAENKDAFIETAIQLAIRRGEFDNLPGAGKPLEGLGTHHDPDWWIRRKIETENLTGLGPPAIMLRVEDDELDDQLDRLNREVDVRGKLADFNRRVIEARRQLHGGPPVVTPLRDIDADVAAWSERRTSKRTPSRVDLLSPIRSKRRWFHR
ncbi:MAG TPA: DUF1992 domain-containing protein [Plantibacter sp.]|uniref:DnaJ family domain-containing protein n=1 Tax=unclassified Plantibacter TaxID=2624265 RepID=UPI002BABC5AE|nr:DUF1992 domain-containing protein [Plantibacter sp.]